MPQSQQAVSCPSGVDSAHVNCRFCGVGERERSVAGSDGIVVIPSVGSLVPGWLLVIPVEHVLTLAEIRVTDREPFSAAASAAASLVAPLGEGVVQFEHGPAREGRSAGCGVDHAHLHVVPVRMRMRASLHGLDPVAERLKWQQTDWPWTARRNAELDYLFVRETDATGWIAEAETIPSQAFRRSIARFMGQAHWDWKDPQTRDERARTYAILTGDRAADHARR